jgi:hypothetical protein
VRRRAPAGFRGQAELDTLTNHYPIDTKDGIGLIQVTARLLDVTRRVTHNRDPDERTGVSHGELASNQYCGLSARVSSVP